MNNRHNFRHVTSVQCDHRKGIHPFTSLDGPSVNSLFLVSCWRPLFLSDVLCSCGFVDTVLVSAGLTVYVEFGIGLPRFGAEAHILKLRLYSAEFSGNHFICRICRDNAMACG